MRRASCGVRESREYRNDRICLRIFKQLKLIKLGDFTQSLLEACLIRPVQVLSRIIGVGTSTDTAAFSGTEIRLFFLFTDEDSFYMSVLCSAL